MCGHDRGQRSRLSSDKAGKKFSNLVNANIKIIRHPLYCQLKGSWLVYVIYGGIYILCWNTLIDSNTLVQLLTSEMRPWDPFSWINENQ